MNKLIIQAGKHLCGPLFPETYELDDSIQYLLGKIAIYLLLTQSDLKNLYHQIDKEFQTLLLNIKYETGFKFYDENLLGELTKLFVEQKYYPQRAIDLINTHPRLKFHQTTSKIMIMTVSGFIAKSAIDISTNELLIKCGIIVTDPHELDFLIKNKTLWKYTIEEVENSFKFLS
jgi:hypothetical protein